MRPPCRAVTSLMIRLISGRHEPQLVPAFSSAPQRIDVVRAGLHGLRNAGLAHGKTRTDHRAEVCSASRWPACQHGAAVRQTQPIAREQLDQPLQHSRLARLADKQRSLKPLALEADGAFVLNRRVRKAGALGHFAEMIDQTCVQWLRFARRGEQQRFATGMVIRVCCSQAGSSTRVRLSRNPSDAMITRVTLTDVAFSSG